MKRLPTVEWGQVLDVPTIAESPVSFELEVKKEIPMGDGSDIFPVLCHKEITLADSNHYQS